MSEFIDAETVGPEYAFLVGSIGDIFMHHANTCGVVFTKPLRRDSTFPIATLALESEVLPDANYRVRLRVDSGKHALLENVTITYVGPDESNSDQDEEFLQYYVTQHGIRRYWADGYTYDTETIQELREDIESATWSPTATNLYLLDVVETSDSTPPLI
jgi:hypothetical protein